MIELFGLWTRRADMAQLVASLSPIELVVR
jgi:hypothetical protein